MGKILVVGSYMTDVAVYTPRFPKDGETLMGSGVKFGPGGKGSNQATAAHRVGGEVVMFAKIGCDFLSSVALTHYGNEGMTDRYLLRDEEHATGCAIIEVNEQTAENRIIVMPGSNQYISVEEVRAAEEEFRTCDVVLLQLEANLEATAEAARLGRKHGKTVILNTAPFREIEESLFSFVDYVTPNETEASYYSGVQVTDESSARLAAEVFLAKGVKNVVITLGKAGAYVKAGDTDMVVPAYRVQAADTTGAGDAFNGGFAVALSEGKSVEDAVRFASAVAGLSVTKQGASAAMPHLEDVLRLMEEQKNS